MNLGDLTTRGLQRAGDDPNLAPELQYYTPGDMKKAFNMAQRIFVLVSMCLETTATLTLTGSPFVHVMTVFADWMYPLRIRNAAGARVKVGRLADLAALDVNWPARSGQVVRYAHLGFDLLAVYKQSTEDLDVTYARSPGLLVNFTDVPEIPERHHPLLIDGALPLLRIREGQQEWQKVLPYWDRFMDGAKECADKVRARNREQGYDYVPMEIKRYDRSHILQKAS